MGPQHLGSRWTGALAAVAADPWHGENAHGAWRCTHQCHAFQPPESVTLVGAAPSSVGIFAMPRVCCHCGQGACPPAAQVLGTHEPSISMASLPCGSSCC